MSKLRLGFVKSLIKEFKFKYGDETISSAGIKNCVGNTCSITFANENFGDDCLITSFAPRKNKGEQPCGDDVPVVVSWFVDGEDDQSNSDAHYFRWSFVGNDNCDIESWKPDLGALIKMQDEFDEKKVKPRVKVEYVKTEFEKASKAVEAFEDGEKLYSADGNKFAIPSAWDVAHCFFKGQIFRKVETEISWQDEIKELLGCAYETADIKYMVKHDSEFFIKMCHLVSSLNK